MFDFFTSNHTEVYITTLKKKQEFIDEFFELFKNEFRGSYIHHKDIHQGTKELVFRGPPFRYTWNGWNIFNPVAKGHLRFSEVGNLLKLDSQMFFTEFLITIGLLSFAAIPGFFMEAVGYGILWLVVLWLFFYGGTRLISYIRIHAKIKRLIRKVNDPTRQERTLGDVWKEDQPFVAEVISPFFQKNSKG